MTILIINTITGLFLIGVGYAVKAYPDLIAGYNTMPAEKKKKVDIVGLSTMMKKNLIVQGITIIVLSVIFAFLRIDSGFVMIVVILAGCGICIVKGQKYDGNRSAKPSVKPPTEEDYNKMLDELKEK